MNLNFNIKTYFVSDNYYIFDKVNTHIYESDAVLANNPKYLTICGGGKVDSIRTAFYLCGLKNVTLDFDGAVITLHGKIQPFIIDNCENITIKNLTVQYERALFTELEVIKNNGFELHTKVLDDFPCRVENGYLIPYCKDWESRNLHTKGCMFIQAFDKVTRAGKGLKVIYLGEEIVEEETPPASNIAHIKVREKDGRVVLIGAFPNNWDNRTVVVLEHEPRTYSSVAMFHTKNIMLSNYRVLNGGGMGFYAVYCENITLDSVKFTHDELSQGIISNSADAIHFVACKGDVLITDSIFEGVIDDVMNVHGNYYHTVSANADIIKARRCYFTKGLNAYTKVFGIGDTIAVYNGRTLEEKGRFVIKDVNITGEWSLELKVDKNAEFLCEDDLIENLSSNPKLTVKNCVMGKVNSHVRLQTRGDTLFENCDFELPVMLTGDMEYWFESGPVENAIFQNCRFHGERGIIKIYPQFNPTEKAPYYHCGLKIYNSVFENNNVLSAKYAENITLEGVTALNGEEIIINTVKCDKITVE